MIIVTGSTGGFGNSAIGSLLEKGISAGDIIAFARNREKAMGFNEMGIKVRMGDYDDYDSLERAFTGADKLLFVSGSEVEKRNIQHENIIRAAINNGVKHIIYTSFDRKSDDRNSPISEITDTHINTEKRIRETGISYTFLRNALYAEGIPMFIGNDVLEKGIYFPAGDGKVPFASRSDMAEAAAVVISGKGHENKSYYTVNTHNYSFYEIASILSEISGKEIKYFCPTTEQYAATLSQAGVPAEVIRGITGWAEGVRLGYFESDYSDLENLLGRKPQDLKTILSDIYARHRRHHTK